MWNLLKIALFLLLALLMWGCGKDESTTGPNGDDNGITISLSLIGSLPLQSANDVVVMGNTAYIADDQLILATVDISDKANPEMLGFVGRTGSENGVALAISGSHAFVAVEGDGLYVVDIAAVDSPFVAYKFGGPYAKDVAVSGNYAFIADQDFGLRIVDISNPVLPILIGSYPGDGPFGVAVSGNFAYCADNDSGFCIIDISSPTSPSEVGRYLDLYSPRQIEVQNQLAFVQTDTAMVVFDVSNTAQPEPRGSYALGCRYIAVEGNLAYITTGYNRSLAVVDVSDLAQIRLLDSITTPGLSYGLDVNGDFIYVAAQEQFLIYGK